MYTVNRSNREEVINGTYHCKQQAAFDNPIQLKG